MAGERLKRKRILGAAIEATPGTAETLDAGDAAINVYDAVIQPDFEYTDRPKNGSMSQLAPIPGARKGKCTFKTELIGGTGTILQVLLQGCGCKLSAGVLTPQSKPPQESGSSTKTLTIAIWQHGKKKQIHGAQGNAVLRMQAGAMVEVEFEFSGVWDEPVDEALVSPTYPTAAPLQLQSGAISLGSWSLKTQKLDFDLGNNVVYRFDGSAKGGIFAAAITDRNPKIAIDAEATLVADNDIYGLALASTAQAFAATMGSTGNKVAIAAPKAVVRMPQEGDRDKLEIDDAELVLCANTDAGDDEWSITFS